MGSEMPVAEAIAGALARVGTRHAFGVPGGGSNLALVAACVANGIDFVLCHSENSAAIMAATCGELTGAPGLALATRGPGAMSAVNGCAHALLDRAPMVLVTDAIPHQDRGRTTHQLVDHGAVFDAVAKASLEIGVRTQGVAEYAVGLALQPPWGPVHLDVVLDATDRHQAEGPTPGAATGRTAELGPIELPRVWTDLISACSRPLLLIGVGARGLGTTLAAALDDTGVPMLCTYKAKGLMSETAGAFAGLLTGAAIESDALHAADLLIAIGLDPVELIPAAWRATASVLSLNPWEIEDTYIPYTDQLVADPSRYLAELAQLLAGKAWDVPGRGRELGVRLQRGGMDPATLVEEVRRAAPDGSIATVDAGAHMLVAMPLWTSTRPGETLISSGLATMGFALPAAIAASLCHPRKRVVCFTGDGGLGMCLSELETLARRRLDVLVIVFNDSLLSLIDIKQEGVRGGSAVSYERTDFAGVAQACGVAAVTCSDVDTLRDALDRWTTSEGPMLLDVLIDPTQYPQVMAEVRGG